MSEGLTGISLLILIVLIFVLILSGAVGAFVFKKRAQPMWKGFMLGAFTGGLLSLIFGALILYLWML